MRVQWKNILFGFLLGCMVMFITTIMQVNAASTSWIEIVVNNVNVMLDGTVVGH